MDSPDADFARDFLRDAPFLIAPNSPGLPVVCNSYYDQKRDVYGDAGSMVVDDSLESGGAATPPERRRKSH
ncbi:hypothetical protein K440DRAFT_611256, partial [Wilcoxina mikolae CBS 423.85]